MTVSPLSATSKGAHSTTSSRGHASPSSMTSWTVASWCSNEGAGVTMRTPSMSS